SPLFIARLSALPLDRPDTLTANDADSASIAVQAVLALSSAGDQSLTLGSSPLPAAPFLVTDGTAPAITAAADVRIRIPVALPMAWDGTVGTLALSESAAAKVSANVAYENSGRVLVLDVLQDFAAGDRLAVSGAAFVDRTASGSGRLELEVDGAGTLARVDDKTVTIVSATGAPEPFVPPGLRLAAPAPNPFRGSTTLRYELPRAQTVRLAVHDVTGRKLRELAAGPRSAGRYSVVWDGRDGDGRRVAAGVYFVRLRTGAEEQTRKIVLLR
ncbi:MAG TPA: FlgD immunoglobulin-like domain containing protein, partial [bacterium]|nr:FlgD immunoglobulin-like domain containing protein [bacterium]